MFKKFRLVKDATIEIQTPNPNITHTQVIFPVGTILEVEEIEEEDEIISSEMIAKIPDMLKLKEGEIENCAAMRKEESPKILILNPKNKRQMYILSEDLRDDKIIWITRGDGEGGEFNMEKFFQVVDTFYKDNF